MKNYHAILEQQLKKYFTTPEEFPNSPEFLRTISQTYSYLEKEVNRLKGTLKLSASELNEANAEMTAIFKVLPDIVLRINPENRISYANGGHNHECHFHAEDFFGLHIQDFPIGELAEKLQPAVPRVRKTNTDEIIEFILDRHDKRFYFKARLLPFFADNIIVVIRDITKSKTAELRLKKAHKETEQILASISSILIGVGKDDHINRWNHAAEKSFGLKAKNVIGKMFIQCGIKWDWITVLENIAESRERNTPTCFYDIHFTRPDGHEGILNITINPVLDDDKNHAGYLLLGSEITEQKFLEGQLAQSQKLESIGQLAAGIAHEINTPTQYVGDNIHFLSTAFGKLNTTLQKHRDFLQASQNGGTTESMIRAVIQVEEQNKTAFLIEEIPAAINESLDGIGKITEIVKAMKEYSHPGSIEKTFTDINKALENTITVSRNEWKYHADLHTDFNPELPKIPCLPGELNQVFLNIIVNAAHAISDANEQLSRKKGLITITTDFDEKDAIITFRDSGIGISEKHRKKIFDPFFTTKDEGKGTGQGLAIAHKVIVKNHHGSINFESEEGKGTVFIIRLPRHSCPSEESTL